MKIYNIVKCSFVDYPGQLAAVIFLRGCNFNCTYCHNAHIIPVEGDSYTTKEDVFTFLKNRKNVLSGIVVTGGEPTIHGQELITFMKELRSLGSYNLKLDTNGYRPDILKQLIDLNLVDYIAMDIKATQEKYTKIIQIPYNHNKIQTSINLIKNSGLPHQFRTTFDKRTLSDVDIDKIKQWIDDPSYIVQECILRDINGNPI